MKSYDYEAVVYDGAEYCVECLPEGVKVHDEEVSPIFADAEMDRPAICDNCGTEHTYMNITGDRERDDVSTPLEEALITVDAKHADPTKSLAEVLEDVEARYGEAALIRAIAEHWRRCPEILVSRLREAGVEVR